MNKEEDVVVCVCHPNENAYSETFIKAHINKLPAKVINGYGVWFPLRIDKSVLKQIILENKVDAVLAEYGPTGVAIMEVCQEVGVPMIVHFHGGDAHNAAFLMQVGKYYPELFAKAAKIIASSQDMRRRLLELEAPSEKVYVNPYGVDISLFDNAEPGSSLAVFLAVGRFVDKKAPYLTLLAFRKVLDRVTEARLIMVGDGQLLEACKQITKSLKMSDAVEFLGVRTPAEIATLMKTGRAFVQHSIRTTYGDAESLGVVFLEAGASGLPVVATRHDGIPEVVLDGKTGFLVEEGDVDGMAECMLRLAQNPTLASQLGKAARDHIRTNFSQEKSISGLWDIIETAIKEHRDRSSELIRKLNLREINLIVFPDWSKNEERISVQLEKLIRSVVNHSEKRKINLLIETSDIDEEDANLILSGVAMNLLLLEELDVTEGPEISSIRALSEREWEMLLCCIHARIMLENENQMAVKAENIRYYKLDSFAKIKFDGEGFDGEG